MSLVMGIDPSYTCTGIVVLDYQCRLITSSKIRIPSGPSRMLRGGKALHALLRDFSPKGVLSLAILEDAAYGAPSRITVAKLKELSGVYKFILEAHGVEWLELSPSASKKYITGKGTSEKHIVARELARVHGLRFDDDKGFDLSDAAALAVWGVTRGVERGSAREMPKLLHKHGDTAKHRRR